jgi:hypothetical protein
MMPIRTIILTGLLLALALSVAAQEVESPDDLSTQEIEISEQEDIYGQTIQVAHGLLVNQGSTAYTNISLNAAVYDEDDEQIGEGIGFLVDACGAGLLPGFTLRAEHTQSFNVPLELYELNAEIERVEIMPRATPIKLDEADAFELPEGFTQVTDQEVVEVEWNGPRSLRYAVGCGRDPFIEWTWNSYNSLTGTARPVEHPSVENVNNELRERLGLTDPLLFNHAFIRYAPSGTRLVFQNHVNTVYTAAANGTLLRALFRNLTNRTLQEIYWLDNDRFLASYFGAYGDPVLYFTADAEGRFISPSPLDNRPSAIMPGPSRDARRVVIAGDFEDGTGYYLNVLTYSFFELLFEAELPGNNWPGPLPIVDPERDLVVRVYVARPEDGIPMIQCFNREEGVLHDLATLPLNLTESDRAQWWISPDERTIALASSGINGGLWLIDLNSLPDCQS